MATKCYSSKSRIVTATANGNVVAGRAGPSKRAGTPYCRLSHALTLTAGCRTDASTPLSVSKGAGGWGVERLKTKTPLYIIADASAVSGLKQEGVRYSILAS